MSKRKRQLGNRKNEAGAVPIYTVGDLEKRPHETKKQLKKQNTMIIMQVKEGENIERALKKFKRKYERTGVLKELRRRQYFTKPSIQKREAMMHAVYVEHMYRNED